MYQTITQDVTDILEHNKLFREAQRGRSKDYHKLARIPTTLIDKLIGEGRLTHDFFRDKGQQVKLMEIVRREYPKFLSTDKKIPFKGK